MQEPGGSYPGSLEEGWRHGEPRIAPPDNGAFPGTGINKDERHLAKRSRGFGEIAMDTGTPEFATMKLGKRIVAHHTNVMGAQPPALASDERGCHLATGHDLYAEHLRLGAQ